MSSPTNFPIDLKPSRRLAVLLGSAHGLAVVAAWSSLLGWPLYLSVSGIVISAAACLAESLHLPPRAATRLELDTGGRCTWRDRRGEWHEARLGAEHFVSTWLVVICLLEPMLRRKWIVILPDSVPADEFRRLRVWLRWQPEPRREETEKSEMPH
jgi:toxin CptA